MVSTPSPVIRVEALLEVREGEAIDAWGASYRAAPDPRTMARFLEERFGMELVTDPAIVGGFAGDESQIPGQAEGLCRPRCAREVAVLLRAGRAAGVPVTVSAGRSNLTGSATPAGGIVLSTVRLVTPAWRIDREARTVATPAGVILEDLRNAVTAATAGTLCYPVDPTSRAEATVGGSLACNASGFTPGAPGTTRYWTQALEMVLPCGGLIRVARGEAVSKEGCFVVQDASGRREVPVPRHPRAAVKNAGGPYSSPDGVMDFVDLAVGSEGLFGVVTGAVLRLAERPHDYLDLFLSLPAEEEAVALRDALAARLPGGLESLAALEYFGLHGRRFMQHEEVFFHGADPVGIYLSIPLSAGEALEDAAESWLERLTGCGVAIDPDAVLALDTPRARTLFMEARHSLPAHALEIVRRRGARTLMTDTVVPPAAFRTFLADTHALLRQHGLEYLAFGHLGDCHLHFMLLPEKTQMEQATRAYDLIVARSAALGGVYSGEHGTGKRKRADFEACHGAAGIREVRRTKAALDPEFLLNRGNVVAAP